MKQVLFAAAFMAALQAGAAAQSYPSRPVTLIAPFPAGGPLDTIARIISEPMRVSLGQPVVIENVAGAGGNIGTGRVARAAPDGYTIGIGQWSTHVVNPITYSLQYNVLTDFEPVALLTITPQLIIARKDFPAKDIRELVTWLKANPGKATGATYQLVPYRGTGPAMQDLISGQIQVMVDQSSNSLPQVQAGKIRAYAQTSAKRSPAMADIPTAAEAGYPMEVSIWNGLWAPKGTPKDIIDKLNAAAVTALSDAAVRKRMEELGQDLPTAEEMKPATFAAFQKAELGRWKPILEAAGVKAE